MDFQATQAAICGIYALFQPNFPTTMTWKARNLGFFVGESKANKGLEHSLLCSCTQAMEFAPLHCSFNTIL